MIAALLIAAVLLCAGMAAVWATAVRIRNAGIVDIASAASFSVLAVVYGLALPGHAPRRALACGMTILWSLRLASYLYRRVMGHHPVEDGRYPLASPWGWLTVYCPALMLYFLFRVTGIPATEAQALKSRGDDYRQYQATTSAFVPWFPRPAAKAAP